MLAYADIATIRFPRTCPHCGQAAEATRAIGARRNLEGLAQYAPFPVIDVPVCRSVFERRRRASLIFAIARVAFLFVGGFIATALLVAKVWLSAGVLSAAIVALALAARTGWDDALLDAGVLGIRARSVPGKGRVRLWFARDAYFSEWAALNPSASMSAGETGWQPAATPALVPALVWSRKAPLLSLAAAAPLIALLHWQAWRGGVVVLGLSLLTALAVLAAAGLLYPPLFWSVSTHGRSLPLPTRIGGALLASAGLAAGFLLGVSYSHG